MLKEAEEFLEWRVAGGEALATRVVNVPSSSKWLRAIEGRLKGLLGQGYPVDCSGLVLAEAAIVRYVPGAVVPQHTDTNPEKRNRILSIVLYLTGSFDGGVFEVPRLGFEGIAPQGAAIVFPSEERHSAGELTAGDKSVFVGFFELFEAK